MRVGIIVDGDAESQALRLLTRRLMIQGTNIMDPVYANMQPKATAKQIARAAKATADILLVRGAERLIILIDREDRQECCSSLAAALQHGFETLGLAVDVVIKNKQFENWLVADPAVFLRLKRLFKASTKISKQVLPDRADLITDPVALLDALRRDVPYHKRKDAAVIAEAMDEMAAASNSRSFRRFLRLLNHPNYLLQSRTP